MSAFCECQDFFAPSQPAGMLPMRKRPLLDRYMQEMEAFYQAQDEVEEKDVLKIPAATSTGNSALRLLKNSKLLS